MQTRGAGGTALFAAGVERPAVLGKHDLVNQAVEAICPPYASVSDFALEEMDHQRE